MKKYTKEIVLVLITVIVVSVISVSATVYFNSENIVFEPEDTNWNVNNTSSALNDLYSTMNTKLNSTTAIAGDILSGKTAYSRGILVTGTMANKGALNWNPTTSTTYTVEPGYYSGGTLNSSGAYNAGYNAGTTNEIYGFGSDCDYATKAYAVPRYVNKVTSSGNNFVIEEPGTYLIFASGYGSSYVVSLYINGTRYTGSKYVYKSVYLNANDTIYASTSPNGNEWVACSIGIVKTS